MPRRLLICLLPFLVAAALPACSPQRPTFHGADITGSTYGQVWHLLDGTGKTRTLADYRGEVLLVYFGYTHCPDICPATLGNLRTTLGQLGERSSQVRVLFITVDAENDTPLALQTYLLPFGPRFTGLSGSEAALADAARDFKAYAAKKSSAAAGSSFEHAGFVYALDRKGAARILYGPESTPEDITADVRRLLTE
jgi:protein SCO1/2